MKTKRQRIAIRWAAALRFEPPIFQRAIRARRRQRRRRCARGTRATHCRFRVMQYALRNNRAKATRAVR